MKRWRGHDSASGAGGTNYCINPVQEIEGQALYRSKVQAKTLCPFPYTLPSPQQGKTAHKVQQRPVL